jgi:translation elongation factor P/translation initiation factor 5A
MSEALKSGMEVSLDDGNLVKITDSIFVNSGKISAQAIRYAESKGVTIYQTTPYTQVPS